MFRTTELLSRSSVSKSVHFLAHRIPGPRAFFVSVLVGLVLPLAAQATGRSDVLEAIHAVENPLDSSKPGRHGELGPYQFRSSTWGMYTRAPFEQALNRALSEEVAIRHYEWIRRGLIRAGFAPSPYNIALAWNGGLSATIRRRVSPSSRHYAERVANLTQELSTSRLAVVR